MSKATATTATATSFLILFMGSFLEDVDGEGDDGEYANHRPDEIATLQHDVLSSV